MRVYRYTRHQNFQSDFHFRMTENIITYFVRKMQIRAARQFFFLEIYFTSHVNSN